MPYYFNIGAYTTSTLQPFTPKAPKPQPLLPAQENNLTYSEADEVPCAGLPVVHEAW